LNLQQAEAKVLKKNEAKIIDANIEQLKRGEDASGSKFPEYEYESYYKGKASQGLTEQAGKHYNLLLTGDFREGFFAKFENANMIIDSKDEKRNKLVRLVPGQPIFGTQDRELEKINPDLIEDLQTEILDEWFKGI
jgi:hypothetical protein